MLLSCKLRIYFTEFSYFVLFMGEKMRHLYSFFLLTQTLHFTWQEFCSSYYLIKNFSEMPAFPPSTVFVFWKCCLFACFLFQVVLTNQMTTRFGQNQSMLVPALGRCSAFALCTTSFWHWEQQKKIIVNSVLDLSVFFKKTALHSKEKHMVVRIVARFRPAVNVLQLPPEDCRLWRYSSCSSVS